MVHFPTNKAKACKFNTMLITPPPPSSEPPPPYSPPRNITSTSSRQSSNGLSPNTQFPFFPTDLSLAKKARAALNHGPSSAFHPPSKGKIMGEPPPYSLTDNTKSTKHRYDMELRDLKSRQLVDKCAEISILKNHIDSRERDFFLSAGQTLKTPRELYQHAPATVANFNMQTAPNVTPSNPSKEQNHPQGPLLRTGKSLQIPGSRRTLRHHLHATTHQHPSSAHISNSRERQHRQTYSFQSPQSFNSSHLHQANRGASFETRSYDGSGRSLRYKIQNIIPLGSPPPHALHIARPYNLQPQGQSARGTLAGTSNSQESHLHPTHPSIDYPSRYDPHPINNNHLTVSNSDDSFRSFNNMAASRKHEFYHKRGYRDDGHLPRNEFLKRQSHSNASGHNALQNDIPFSDSEDGARRSHRSRLSRFVEHMSRDGAADRDRRRSAHSRTGRTTRLEQEAASSMISARAFPALVTTPRMRSCRSLDELSDLLHEDLERFDGSSFSPLPSIARSLDDLTEPLYMNVPLRSTLPASHCLNTSVPDVLEPPPLPAKPKRGRTISLSPVTIRDEMTSLQEQLEKIKQVAFVLGNKVERGEFTSTLGSNSSRPSQHHSTKQYPGVSQGHNSAFKRILPSNTNANSPRLNSQRLDPPGVPSRAPVINDVSFLLNQEASAKFNISDPTASLGSREADVDAEVNATDYQRYHAFAVNQCPEDVSLSYSRTPDPDSSSHESGYSSTDSRSGATRRPKLSPEEFLDFNILAERQSQDQLSNPRTHSDRFLERYPHQSTPSRHQPPRRCPLSNVPDVLRRDGPVPPPRVSPPSGHFLTPPGSAACTLPQQRSDRDTLNSGECRRVRSTSGSRVNEALTRNSQQRDHSPVHHSPQHHSMDYLQDNVPRNVSNEPRRLSRNHIERFENPTCGLGNVSSHHFNTPGPMSTHNKLYGSMDQLRADMEHSWGPQEAGLLPSDHAPTSLSFARDPRTAREEGPRSSQWESNSREHDRSKLNNRRSCPPELPKKLRNQQINEREGLNQDQLGIYIKSVVPGGSADQDGRLQAGDQLLSVDGRSLVGISQERAAEYMKKTGPTVVLEVARQGAFYHGLATVLEQPSPQGVRPPIHGVPPARPASERDIPSKLPPHPLLRGPPPAAHLQPRMQPAKSVPALNSELSLSGELSKSTSHDQSLMPHPPPHHPQDIFNPNYSRTSSSNSLTPHHTTLSNSLSQPAPSQHPPHHLQHQPPHGSQMLPPPPHPHLSMPLRSRSTQNLSDNDDRHYQNISFHAANPHRSPHAVQPAPQLRDHPAHQPRPASALLQRDEPGRADPSFRPDLYRPASQRDLRPQEPRLVHLPEEGPNGQLPPASMRHQPLHQQSPGGGSGGGFTPTKQAPPPTAPKPKPLDRSGQQPHAFRPPIREEGNGYRDSPPPPPPPTSTHPLLQGSSSNEPTTRQPFFSKTSAWEREEKERYEKRRREAARQWRDEQISQLERQPHKTPQEEERLKTLQLEREFELRAKQADEEEENSEDEDDERITSMAEDTRTDDPIMIDRRDQAEKEAVRGGVPRGGPGFLGGVNGGGPADEERAKRADEIRRKQQELEVASEVEQKLLREAQRRQEEEANARRYQQQQYQQFKNNPQQASQRLDSLVGAPAGNEFTNGPMNGLRTSNSFEQNFNNGNINPPPPERNSSYNVMQQQQQHHQYQQHYSSSTNNARLRNPSMESSPPSASNVGTVKRVQFSESHHTSTTSVLDVSSSSTVSFDANANKEDRSPIKYNPNDFINEAENMLNFSPSPIRNPGSAPATPGVIGAQEVYRDPRVKRLQEKQALQAASSNRPPVPETLTFREKMKMFAAETGEPETPKDRTKISRAQREID